MGPVGVLQDVGEVPLSDFSEALVGSVWPDSCSWWELDLEGKEVVPLNAERLEELPRKLLLWSGKKSEVTKSLEWSNGRKLLVLMMPLLFSFLSFARKPASPSVKERNLLRRPLRLPRSAAGGDTCCDPLSRSRLLGPL